MSMVLAYYAQDAAHELASYEERGVSEGFGHAVFFSEVLSKHVTAYIQNQHQGASLYRPLRDALLATTKQHSLQLHDSGLELLLISQDLKSIEGITRERRLMIRDFLQQVSNQQYATNEPGREEFTYQLYEHTLQ